jgi:protein-disulfide isomerase
MYDKNKNAFADGQRELPARKNTQIETSEKPRPEKRGPRLFPWLLLVVGLCVGLMAGLYLRPLVMPEANAKAARSGAPLVKPESLDKADTSVAGAVDRAEMQQAVMEAVLAEARHFEGDPDAPVTLVEFSDFKCGYCGKWNRETLPLIRDEYVESGKVQIAHISYPILGPGSMAAAEAAECAGQQGKFGEYAESLYENQRIGTTPDNLTTLAGELGLDTVAFEACLVDFPEKDALASQISLGQMLGVRGTPAFLVNGVPVSGALPYEAFEQIIEDSLDGRF